MSKDSGSVGRVDVEGGFEKDGHGQGIWQGNR